MFEWLNKQGVRSTDGFEFQFTGRFTAEYCEDKSAGKRIVDFEVDGAPVVCIMNSEPLHWRQASNLTSEERSRVLANTKAALEFMDLNLETGPPLKG